MQKSFSGLLRVLWLVSGIVMTLFGVYAVFNGTRVLGTVSRWLGMGALISGIITVLTRLSNKQVTKKSGRLMYFDSLFLIIIGVMLMNTRILERLGKIMFVILGVVIIYHAIQSLAAAMESKSDNDGWFAPRMIFCVLLIAVGVWILFNARKAFTSTFGLTVGIFFISHGISTINDWIGREKYRKNFSFLDN